MNKKVLVILLTALVMTLMLVPLLTNLLPDTYPLSPRVAYADSTEERRESVTRALQDTAEEFGWDTGEIEAHPLNNIVFPGQRYSWTFDVSSSAPSGRIVSPSLRPAGAASGAVLAGSFGRMYGLHRLWSGLVVRPPRVFPGLLQRLQTARPLRRGRFEPPASLSLA